jgi:hypothetical protein
MQKYATSLIYTCKSKKCISANPLVALCFAYKSIRGNRA